MADLFAGTVADTDPFVILGTGSRSFTDKHVIWSALTRAIEGIGSDRKVVLRSGKCPDGADPLMEAWALARGFLVDPHPAQNHPTQDFGPWPAAGPKRNQYMVSLGADVCVAFISPCTSPRCKRDDPHPSHGTTGCANAAKRAGIPVRRYYSL